MQVELFSFPPLRDFPNASPFCAKLEIYLHMADVDFTVTRIKGSRGSPTGKVPFVKLDGQIMADSGEVITALEARLDKPVDADLTPGQRAESLAMQRLLEEHLYWVIVYSRWLDPTGWHGWRQLMSEDFGAPHLLLTILGPLLRRRVRSHLNGHGLGRHSAGRIWAMGGADVTALADWLGEREWAFGDRPHSLDACLAAFTGAVVRMPWDYPLKSEFKLHPKLLAHSERVLSRYYPAAVD